MVSVGHKFLNVMKLCEQCWGEIQEALQKYVKYKNPLMKVDKINFCIEMMIFPCFAGFRSVLVVRWESAGQTHRMQVSWGLWCSLACFVTTGMHVYYVVTCILPWKSYDITYACWLDCAICSICLLSSIADYCRGLLSYYSTNKLWQAFWVVHWISVKKAAWFKWHACPSIFLHTIATQMDSLLQAQWNYILCHCMLQYLWYENGIAIYLNYGFSTSATFRPIYQGYAIMHSC